MVRVTTRAVGTFVRLFVCVTLHHRSWKSGVPALSCVTCASVVCLFVLPGNVFTST